MAQYDDWFNAIERAEANRWTVSSNDDTRFSLTKAGKVPITIELMNTYGYAKCTMGQSTVIKNTPAELLTYINRCTTG
jgi:hypothetical protein